MVRPSIYQPKFKEKFTTWKRRWCHAPEESLSEEISTASPLYDGQSETLLHHHIPQPHAAGINNNNKTTTYRHPRSLISNDNKTQNPPYSTTPIKLKTYSYSTTLIKLKSDDKINLPLLLSRQVCSKTNPIKRIGNKNPYKIRMYQHKQVQIVRYP